jgi:hypothetical protein
MKTALCIMVVLQALLASANKHPSAVEQLHLAEME